MILFNPSLKNLQNKNFTFGKVTNLLNDGVVFGVIFFTIKAEIFVLSSVSNLKLGLTRRELSSYGIFFLFLLLFLISSGGGGQV